MAPLARWRLLLLLGCAGAGPAAPAADRWGPPGFLSVPVLRKLKDLHVMKMKVSRTHAQVVSISIGTPSQELRCLVDSGSSDLWVPSKRCMTCENERFFHADKSSTFMPNLVETPHGLLPRSVMISYGSGQIVGFDVQDTLDFGPYQIKNQSFLIVEDAALPARRSWDGIVGLGWRGLAQVGEPLYERLQAGGHQALFGLMPAGKGKSRLSVGEVPRQGIREGSLVWLPAEGVAQNTGRTFWVVSGGLAIRKDRPTPARFLVDTGTNQLLMVPPRHYMALVTSLVPPSMFEELCGTDNEQSDLILCECSVTEDKSLRPLRLYLGGRPFLVPLSEVFERAATSDGGEVCVLRIRANPMAGIAMNGIMGGLLGDVMEPGAGAGPAPVEPVHQEWPQPGESGQDGANAPGFPGSLFPPFDLPPFLGGDSGDKGTGMPWAGGGGTQVEQISQLQPDGSYCTSTVEYDGTKLIRNETRCSAPSQTSRRLQEGPKVGDRQDGDQRPQLLESQVDELWVLGGVLLERFVTIFDFDKARLGFAESAELEPVLDTVSDLSSPSQLSESGANSDSVLLGLAGAGDAAKVFCLLLALVAGMVLVLMLGFVAWKVMASRGGDSREPLATSDSSDAFE